MHPVHIGIGGDYHAVVAQIVHRVFNVQGVLEEVKFLILVHYFLGQAVAVERFTAKAEDCLGVYIPGFGEGSTRGIALGDKDRAGQAFLLCCFVIKMVAAVPQLFVVDVGFFSLLTLFVRDEPNAFMKAFDSFNSPFKKKKRLKVKEFD